MPWAEVDPIPKIDDIKAEVTNIETAVAPARGTTTANGLLGGTTVVDTTRTEPNDHWNTMALLITNGAQAGQVREITDWVLATGTFTVAPAFGGQIVADVTYKILTHLPADIDIAEIEAKLDSGVFGLATIKAEIVVIDTEIAAIEAKLDHGTHGLASIKSEIVDVEAKLDHETHGLANIKAEIVAIEAKLDHETSGLASIKTEIVAIEAKLDHETNGLASIKTEIIAIEAKLDHETYGLAEIKSEVTSIETKVDAIIDVGREVVDVVIYPVAEDQADTEITDDGSSPALTTEVTKTNADEAAGMANPSWSEDIDLEQAGTITVISIFYELHWQMKRTGGSGDVHAKWQISGDGGGSWVDVTDNVAEGGTVYASKTRIGVGRHITTITAGANQLQLRLCAWKNSGTSVETKVRSDSYIRVTSRKS